MSLQLVQMLTCYRKHIEVDGGSQNYRGQVSHMFHSAKFAVRERWLFQPPTKRRHPCLVPDNGAGRI